MQYKNIALKGEKKQQVYLVKYRGNLAKYIYSLEQKNENLAKELLNPSPNNMAYFVVNDEDCLGAILINPASETKNINLEILLDEAKLSQDGIYNVVDNIVTSLGWYLYDKENIIIKLDNGFDLTTYNRHKYVRKPIGKGQMIYQYYNRNHKLITNLTHQMMETQTNLLNNDQYWVEDVIDDNIAYVNNNLKPEKFFVYPLEEAFYNTSKITWNLNENSKNKNKIIFQKDGKIEFIKNSLKDDNLSYRICSWIDQNHFRLENKALKLDLEWMPTLYVVNLDKTQVVVNKDDNTRQYRYSSNDKKSKVDIEIKIKATQFQEFNIMFYTYDNEHILESEYLFEVSLSDDRYSFKHISYEGTFDLIPYLKEEDKVLLFNLKRGNLPIEKLDKTIQRLVKIINIYASSKDLTMVGYENLVSVANIILAEDKVINYLKGINGEILVPNIQEKVTNFLDEKNRAKVKYLSRSRSLKKQERN